MCGSYKELRKEKILSKFVMSLKWVNGEELYMEGLAQHYWTLLLKV